MLARCDEWLVVEGQNGSGLGSRAVRLFGLGGCLASLRFGLRGLRFEVLSLCCPPDGVTEGVSSRREPQLAADGIQDGNIQGGKSEGHEFEVFQGSSCISL